MKNNNGHHPKCRDPEENCYLAPEDCRSTPLLSLSPQALSHFKPNKVQRELMRRNRMSMLPPILYKRGGTGRMLRPGHLPPFITIDPKEIKKLPFDLRRARHVGTGLYIPPRPPLGYRLARYLRNRCLLRVERGERLKLTWFTRIRFRKTELHTNKSVQQLLAKHGCTYCGKYE